MAQQQRTRDGHYAWLGQVAEKPLDPDLPICDAHHHLWLDHGHTGWPYTLDDLHADTGGGHNIVHTVFMECGAQYRDTGPEHLRAVGETEFVAELAEESTRRPGQAEISAIVAHADVSLGDAVDEVLAAHVAAGRGRFRGVRYITARDDYPPLYMGPNAAMDDPQYLEGVRRVGELGYCYDANVFHPQLPDLVAVARACPDTPIVIDHLGIILGVGPYRDRRAEILAFWRGAMDDLAACPNTLLKIGGIGMPLMGLRWDKQDLPPTSDHLADPWFEPIRYVIDLFGPDRCMFESNFPVDQRGVNYTSLWNAFKKIATPYTAEEKRDLFHNTAARTYQIPLVL